MLIQREPCEFHAFANHCHITPERFKIQLSLQCEKRRNSLSPQKKYFVKSHLFLFLVKIAFAKFLSKLCEKICVISTLCFKAFHTLHTFINTLLCIVLFMMKLVRKRLFPL